MAINSTEKDIISLFTNNTLDSESKEYLHTHAKRYAFNINTIESLKTAFPENAKILDIGPSFFIEILRHYFPKNEVYTIGFKAEESRGGHFPAFIEVLDDHYYVFNLNDTQVKEKWIQTQAHDLIIFSEVIEHLYTSPNLVLAFLSTCLKKNGYILIQTPNAVSLIKRIKMLFGVHPYEQIRENHLNPGHYREYTQKELRTMLEKNGFTVKEVFYKSYFSKSSLKGKLYNKIQSFMPGSWRDAITLVAQKN